MRQPLRTAMCILLSISQVLTYAQHRYDQQWLLGYDNVNSVSDPNSGQGGTLIDFRQGTPQQSYLPIKTSLIFDNGQICDPQGELAFYTNGCRIIGPPNISLPNGDTINPGTFWNNNCTSSYQDYNGFQTTLALPWPGREDFYALFHCGWDNSLPPNSYSHVKKLYFSTVDMADGQGVVLEKNVKLLQDSLTQDLSAVRHANGRDWWLVLPQRWSNKFFIFLFDPWGARLYREQSIGIENFGAETSQFSQDGSRYARVSEYTGVDLFHFDRCSGEFSRHQRLPFAGQEVTELGSPCFSPSGRYLYVTSVLDIDQYDLWATDIAASRVRVAHIDNPNHTIIWGTYFDQQLAPDGRIYVCASNGYRYLHVIQHPDSAGLACGFVDSGLPLLTHTGFTLPTHPNYALRELPCSPCDSLRASAPDSCGGGFTGNLRSYPNPVRDFAKIVLPPGEPMADRVQVHAVSGQFLREQVVAPTDWLLEVDLRDLPAGMYFISIRSEGRKRPWVAKVVKM
jgi:hypothetical protein